MNALGTESSRRVSRCGHRGLNSENNPNNKPMIVSVYALLCKKDKKISTRW